MSETQIKNLIRAEARRQGVNPALALTIANMESNFDPDAVSPTGAGGLFQMTGIAIADVVKRGGGSHPPRSRRPAPVNPSTGNPFNWNGRDRRDVSWNIRSGIQYIRIIARELRLDVRSDEFSEWVKIYAAYNLGPSSYRALVRGDYNNHALRVALGPQAAVLRRNGPELYLSNVGRSLALRKTA